MNAISGTLTEKEVRRALSSRRSQTIGPTTVYYSGVTAPIISAGMALFSKTALENAGMELTWAILVSSIIAAFAGISWYLIFMRLASRQSFGRDSETELTTEVLITEMGLIVRRGGVETHIASDAVEGVEDMKRHVHVLISSAPDIVLPHRWFASDSDRGEFVAALEKVSSARLRT